MGIPDGKGKWRPSPYVRKGASDIFGIFLQGKFLAIEVKRPKKELTVNQKQFIDEVNAAGGVAFKSCSLEELNQGLEKAKNEILGIRGNKPISMKGEKTWRQ